MHLCFVSRNAKVALLLPRVDNGARVKPHRMSPFQSARLILLLVSLCGFLASAAFAHPGSGIVVDAQGHIYFIYTNRGVMRIEPSGTLTNVHAEDKGGHWLALDARGSFSQVTPKEFQRITPDGAIPALIFADGGAPLVVGADGALCNGSASDSFPPGALTVVRLSPGGRKELFSPPRSKTSWRN